MGTSLENIAIELKKIRENLVESDRILRQVILTGPYGQLAYLHSNLEKAFDSLDSLLEELAKLIQSDTC